MGCIGLFICLYKCNNINYNELNLSNKVINDVPLKYINKNNIINGAIATISDWIGEEIIEERRHKNVIYKTIIHLNNNIDPNFAKSLSVKIIKECAKYNLDWMLMTSIMYQESKFNPMAVNNQGIGLGQIEPLWSKKFNYQHGALWDWRFNIEIMAKIMNHYKLESNNNDNIYWASAYHSYTPKYRNRYHKAIINHYKKILKYNIGVYK